MLSETIKKLREQTGLTQEELAIRLNVVRQTATKTATKCKKRLRKKRLFDIIF